MDLVALIREVGIPFALLIAAVGVLWRSWRLECRLRSRDEEERRRGLLERENELYSLYRELALRDLGNLVDRRRARLEEKDGRDRED